MGSNLLFISWSHIKFDEKKETKMQEKIDIMNGNLTIVPVIKDFESKSPEVINEFRPVHDIPPTEKYLSN